MPDPALAAATQAALKAAQKRGIVWLTEQTVAILVEAAAPALRGELVTEHAIEMSGGGMHVRWNDPECERIYPLAQWIPGAAAVRRPCLPAARHRGGGLGRSHRWMSMMALTPPPSTAHSGLASRARERGGNTCGSGAAGSAPGRLSESPCSCPTGVRGLDGRAITHSGEPSIPPRAGQASQTEHSSGQPAYQVRAY
jgi:hypothetical protein